MKHTWLWVSQEISATTRCSLVQLGILYACIMCDWDDIRTMVTQTLFDLTQPHKTTEHFAEEVTFSNAGS